MEMLNDRLRHKKRMDEIEKPFELTKELMKMGHGKKTRLSNVYLSLTPTTESWMSKTAPRTGTGAGFFLFTLTFSIFLFVINFFSF